MAKRLVGADRQRIWEQKREVRRNTEQGGLKTIWYCESTEYLKTEKGDSTKTRTGRIQKPHHSTVWACFSAAGQTVQQ